MIGLTAMAKVIVKAARARYFGPIKAFEVGVKGLQQFMTQLSLQFLNSAG